MRKKLIKDLNLEERTVLEVGIGTGRNIPYYPSNIDLHGVDINKSMHLHAQRKAENRGIDLHLSEADAKDLPYENNLFDSIVLTYALSAIPDNKKALAEAVRVTKPNGTIGILDIAEHDLYTEGGIAGIDLKELVSQTEGIEVVKQQVRYRNLPDWIRSIRTSHDHSQRSYILRKAA